MARKASPTTDYKLVIENIGTFVVGRRKMADEIKIQVEFARMIDGVEPTDWLATVAGWISAFKVLFVTTPPGWDIEEMDPTDDTTYSNMLKVHRALVAKEGSFRSGSKEASSAERTGDVEDGGILVSPEVQPTT